MASGSTGQGRKERLEAYRKKKTAASLRNRGTVRNVSVPGVPF